MYIYDFNIQLKYYFLWNKKLDKDRNYYLAVIAK